MEETFTTQPEEVQEAVETDVMPEVEQTEENVTETVETEEKTEQLAQETETQGEEREEAVEQEIQSEQEEQLPENVEQDKAEEEAEVKEEQPLPDDVTILKEMVVTLTEKINEMNKLFNDRIMYCDHERKIVDDMHAELQKYKQDMNFQMLKPILMDIIDMRNSMLMNAKLCQKKPEGERYIPLDTFLTFAEGDAENILLVNDVMIFDAQVGDKFDPAKQRVVKKIKTTDQEQHGTIADVMGSGYERNGKVLSPQKVSVYVYEKPVENMETAEEAAPEA